MCLDYLSERLLDTGSTILGAPLRLWAWSKWGRGQRQLCFLQITGVSVPAAFHPGQWETQEEGFGVSWENFWSISGASLVLPNRATGNGKKNENHSLRVLLKLMLVLHSLEHVITITPYYVLQFQKIVSKMFFGLFIFPCIKGKAFPFAPIESCPAVTRLLFFNKSYSTFFCQDIFVCAPATPNAVSAGLGILFIS